MAQEVSGGRTAVDLLQDVARDVGTIVRGELRLARAEISEKAVQSGRGGALIGAGAAIGYLGAAALIAACIAALSFLIPVWAAALLMGALLCLGASMLIAAGRDRLKHLKPVPEKTARTLREDVEWAKQHVR